MSDRHSPTGINLAQALRELPMRAPDRSAWPELAAALRGAQAKPRSRRRYRLPAALAAGIALACIAAFALHHRASESQPIVATIAPPAASNVDNAANGTNVKNATLQKPIDASARLAALQTRSQELERWLHDTDRAAAPLSGQDFAAAAEIEDMIGLVDVQLEAAPHEHETALWRRRVTLLEDLTALRYSSYTLAERGVAAN
jgi:hypothetical protein